MKASLTKLPLVIAISSSIAAPISYASDNNTLVVSATRIESPAAISGSSVSVIDQQDLERASETFVVDYLRRLPGVSISQSGGPGGVVSISLRGAPLSNIVVRLDGVDISDPGSPETTAALQHLLVADIEQIEVLKGPQSALYGGEAVAGVIDIRTKRARGDGLSQRVSLEAGSYRSARGSYSSSYSGERGDLAFTAQGFSTDGFSAAEENDGNSEADGYKNRSFSLRGSFDVTDQVLLKASARHTRSHIETDNAFGGVRDQTAGQKSYDFDEYNTLSAGAEILSFDDALKHDINLQFSNTLRESRTSGSSSFDGKRVKADYLANYQVDDNNTLQLGLDWDKEQAVNSFNFDGDAIQKGGFVQWLGNPIEGLNYSASLRHDDHSTSGSFKTWRLASSYQATETVTLRGSYGSAFRAPSLDQLHNSFYGNSSLEPETSKGVDLGVDIKLSEALSLSASWFKLDTTNLIQYNTATNTYTQVPGETNRRGVELGLDWQISPRANSYANLTYTRARDANDNDLVRVPKYDATIGGNWQIDDKWQLNGSAQYVNGAIDGGSELASYTLVNGKIGYQVNPSLDVYLRVENLLDKEYQTVRNYGTSDRAGYLGLNLAF